MAKQAEDEHEGLSDAPSQGVTEHPGAFPYTRGIHPSMYRERHWTMRQYAGYATAAESNRRYRFLLEGGQTGLSVAFDLPTQLGYDPDHPLAAGEVGRVGVSIASIEDIAVLFDEIPIERVSVSMTINATAAILLAMFVAHAQERGVDPARLSGTIQNDILKEYVARGTHIFPPGASMRLITDTMAFTLRVMPRWNPISVSGYHIREAGATAVQELAFTLANGLCYARAAVMAGMDIDSIAPRLSFFFACHSDFFEEIAKFRAARRVWAHLMRDRMGAVRHDSWKLRFHTQTAGSTLAAQETENNVVRVSLQALAAVLGGTQSLHCNAADEALALPTAASARLALRTQQIIAYESGVPTIPDPLGGSYAVEALTDRIATEATALIERIEALGGAQWAVERGFYARQIEESAYHFQKEIDAGTRVVVGVNRFGDTGDAQEPTFGLVPTVSRHPDSSVSSGTGGETVGAHGPHLEDVPTSVRESAAHRVAEVRARRDTAIAGYALDQLRVAVAGSANVMDALVACAHARCTVGELAGVLRVQFGEYQEREEW